ncbi:MAG: PEP-CTERM sorting domain-containing protein [Planctomycetaceae bacterium]
MALRRDKMGLVLKVLLLGLAGVGQQAVVEGATLLVDDFSVVGTPPAAATNTWNQGSLTGVLGGSREQSKTSTNATTRVWSNTPAGTLSLTASTGTSNVWNLWYDGTSNGSQSNSFNPTFDISSFQTLDIALTQTATTTGNIQLTLVTTSPSNSNWTSTQQLNMPSGSGTVSFALSQMTGNFNPYSLRRILLKFQSFSAGKVTLDNIAFFGADPPVVPEPTTLALASTGVVAACARGLRRRRQRQA